DACVTLEDTKAIEFKKFLSHKISRGAERLSSLIKEEEFRRFNDALSISPTSMIIFDADKRAVFVSARARLGEDIFPVLDSVRTESPRGRREQAVEQVADDRERDHAGEHLANLERPLAAQDGAVRAGGVPRYRCALHRIERPFRRILIA
ncbi:MAG: hypothetical protein HC788_14455, partial [Sphingopyxis sp.]|nr:hypothetical protein [Sphingopyxis sp.]